MYRSIPTIQYKNMALPRATAADLLSLVNSSLRIQFGGGGGNTGKGHYVTNITTFCVKSCSIFSSRHCCSTSKALLSYISFWLPGSCPNFATLRNRVAGQLGPYEWICHSTQRIVFTGGHVR
jgi:hypothetical protein